MNHFIFMMMTMAFFLLFSVAISAADYSELSAIIMPFHRRQLKKLLFNFETWKTFVPSRKDYPSPELIIFASGKDLQDGLKEEILNYFQKQENEHLKEFFSSISVQFANLIANKNSYYRGTRKMLEIVLGSGKGDGKAGESLKFPSSRVISHVFYMEPDCVPIRNYWMDAIHSEITNGAQTFWMKGSKYHGNPQLLKDGSDALRAHLNGNSIYNIGSDEFRSFYFNKVVPQFIGQSSPYDLKIFEVLLMNEAALQKEHGHKFIEANFIKNTAGKHQNWPKYLNQNPATFLHHLCDNWKEYLRFYNTFVSENSQIDIEGQFRTQL